MPKKNISGKNIEIWKKPVFWILIVLGISIIGVIIFLTTKHSPTIKKNCQGCKNEQCCNGKCIDTTKYKCVNGSTCDINKSCGNSCCSDNQSCNTSTDKNGNNIKKCGKCNPTKICTANDECCDKVGMQCVSDKSGKSYCCKKNQQVDEKGRCCDKICTTDGCCDGTCYGGKDGKSFCCPNTKVVSKDKKKCGIKCPPNAKGDNYSICTSTDLCANFNDKHYCKTQGCTWDDSKGFVNYTPDIYHQTWSKDNACFGDSSNPPIDGHCSIKTAGIGNVKDGVVTLQKDEYGNYYQFATTNNAKKDLKFYTKSEVKGFGAKCKLNDCIGRIGFATGDNVTFNKKTCSGFDTDDKLNENLQSNKCPPGIDDTQCCFSDNNNQSWTGQICPVGKICNNYDSKTGLCQINDRPKGGWTSSCKASNGKLCQGSNGKCIRNYKTQMGECDCDAPITTGYLYNKTCETYPDSARCKRIGDKNICAGGRFCQTCFLSCDYPCGTDHQGGPACKDACCAANNDYCENTRSNWCGDKCVYECKTMRGC